MTLMEELNSRALSLGVPISAHLDITYRCNERCDHCYLEHDNKGEMNTSEIFGLLDQLAGAGVFFLTISGGEPLLRRDCFAILARARALRFNVKLKTNAVLIREKEAAQLRELGIEQIQISVYSHRDKVHDGITRLPGSLRKTLAAIRFLRAQRLKVTIANVLMRENFRDGEGVRQLAAELGAHYTLDPTITPMMNGDTGVLRLRVGAEQLGEIFRNANLVGNVEEFCAVPSAPDDSVMDGLPCSAGHTACYISPYGDVYPCVQFPLACGNVRRQDFLSIWQNSPQLREVRSIRARDLPTCSSCAHVGSCTRCPGLAYMEGNMRGPSSADCEKSFVRTGVVTANMQERGIKSFPSSGATVRARCGSAAGLVQIQV